MLNRYADIIIDISHEAIDRAFQYEIPEAFAEDIHIGSQVLIPFGKGDRIKKGYVIGLSNQPVYDVKKIKKISGLADKTVAASGKLIALAAWMKENYGSTMINALKTVMPVKQTVKAITNASVVLKAEKNEIDKAVQAYTKRNAKAKLRLLTALSEEPVISLKQVTDDLHISNQTLKAMEQEQIIEVVRQNVYREVADYQLTDNLEIIPNEEQQAIINDFAENVTQGIQQTYLLHGVTGSGKTEIYVRTIQEVIKQGRQAIVLIPEIALTYQTVRYFRSYFGNRVTIINSKLSSGEKYDQFVRAEKGEVDVVIGPRSALFAPLKRLGLIIVDEEHESSYKSDYPPKYHAREVAIKRAELEDASVILGSATPSVESYRKAMQGEYVLWRLTKRSADGKLAETSIVDLRTELKRGNRSIISYELAEDIQDRLEKRQQIMLFINKRGYNSFISCRSCGEAVKCPHCDVSLTRHQDNRLLCHYCGYSMEEPHACPSCKSTLIGGYGTGTQKVEAEIRKLFPMAKTLRMDKDTTARKNTHEKILEQFGKHEADILIGTQMIVKGHDFPNVTLVGILLADLTLFSNDYRAGERTFDLLTQAAGRAGRGNIPGKVVIQTYQPEHYAITCAAKQDYQMFYEAEEIYRMLMKYPPVWNMMVILLVSEDESLLEQTAGLIASEIKSKFEEEKYLQLIGPSVPVISKIKDIYRRVVYIKHNRYNTLVAVKDVVEAYMENMNESINIQFDFNPINMY